MLGFCFSALYSLAALENCTRGHRDNILGFTQVMAVEIVRKMSNPINNAREITYTYSLWSGKDVCGSES